MKNMSAIDNAIERKRKMTIKEFKKKGYLQELNRNYLHPRGLHLRTENLEGEGLILVPYDYTDDPDGLLYKQELSKEAEEKCNQLLEGKAQNRLDKFQFVIQPIDYEKLPGHRYKKFFYNNSRTANDPEDK